MELTNRIKRHIKFPSTSRFEKLYDEVKMLAANKGRLIYANYDPSLGEPPTEEQIEKLQNYKPDMPTLTFCGSEKLHGENMAVCLSNGNLWVQGRNHVRTVLRDQNGMAHFIDEHKDTIFNLFHQIRQGYDVDITTNTIVLDCEWAGGNIQRGNAACSGTDKGMYIFDYVRVVNNDTQETQYLSTEGLKVFPAESIYLMRGFGYYEVILDFNNPQKCEDKLNYLAKEVEDNSPIAKYFNKPDNVGEGLYLYTTYNNELLRLKVKGTKHGGKPKVPREAKHKLSDEESKQLLSVADKVTPAWRITQGITETDATARNHLRSLIKWVIEDIKKEENVDNIKSISKFVAQIVKDYYFDYLKSYRLTDN